MAGGRKGGEGGRGERGEEGKREGIGGKEEEEKGWSVAL